MRKGINIFWIIYLLTAIALVVVTCGGCVYERPAGSNVRGAELNIWWLIVAPTLLSVLMFFKAKKDFVIKGSIIVFVQSVILSFIDNVFNIYNDVTTNIGGRFYDFEISELGIYAIAISWFLFLQSLAFVWYSLSKKAA